jgi:hypothetical protein
MKGQQANFGGNLFGPTFDATGRVSAIAVDPAGNIYVGAAGGGVWLSKDGGAHFTWISQKLPTQSIGAIAIDILATPPIVYVGTGEGNSAVDTYYGLGLWSTSDFGSTWTQVDPSRFSSNGAFQAFTSLNVPCSGNPFAGTSNGVSSSRGSSDINECEPGIFATGLNCMQGAIYESLGGTNRHRTFGRPNPMDPNGGPVRSLVVGVIKNPDFSPEPAIFGTIDGIGLVVTNDNTGLPFYLRDRGACGMVGVIDDILWRRWPLQRLDRRGDRESHFQPDRLHDHWRSEWGAVSGLPEFGLGRQQLADSDHTLRRNQGRRYGPGLEHEPERLPGGRQS